MSAYNFTPKGAFFINYKEPERIDNAADEGLKLNGVDYHSEEHQNNAFLPWNGIQVNFLSRNFDKMSDEELAKTLGRSVGAVKAKMRQLKLKRKNVEEV